MLSKRSCFVFIFFYNLMVHIYIFMYHTWSFSPWRCLTWSLWMNILMCSWIVSILVDIFCCTYSPYMFLGFRRTFSKNVIFRVCVENVFVCLWLLGCNFLFCGILIWLWCEHKTDSLLHLSFSILQVWKNS